MSLIPVRKKQDAKELHKRWLYERINEALDHPNFYGEVVIKISKSAVTDLIVSANRKPPKY